MRRCDGSLNQRQPSEENGLRVSSKLMVDKITTISKSKVGERVGRLNDEDVVRLNRAVLVFLSLASSARTSRSK